MTDDEDADLWNLAAPWPDAVRELQMCSPGRSRVGTRSCSPRSVDASERTRAQLIAMGDTDEIVRLRQG